MAAHNLKLRSTPITIVLDDRRSKGGGPTLKQLLAKELDCFLNKLVSVTVRFRAVRCMVLRYVKNMNNEVSISCDMDHNPKMKPNIYQVFVNNMVVKPVGSI